MLAILGDVPALRAVGPLVDRTAPEPAIVLDDVGPPMAIEREMIGRERVEDDQQNVARRLVLSSFRASELRRSC